MRDVRRWRGAVPTLRVAGAAAATLLVGCSGIDPTPDPASEFVDVLDLRATPDSARHRTGAAFSDLGAWHMFGLPDPGYPSTGFTGPLLLVDGGRWVGRSFVGFFGLFAESGEAVAWVPDSVDVGGAFPGRLVRRFASGDLRLDLELAWVSDRSAVVRARAVNAGPASVALVPSWAGDASLGAGHLDVFPGGVRWTGEASGWVVEARAGPGAGPVEPAVTSDTTYALVGGPVTVEAGDTLTRLLLVSAYESVEALAADEGRREGVLTDAEAGLQASARRWEGYLDDVLGRLPPGSSEAHRRIAVKAVQTLVSNWRSPMGDLHHDGLFPSWAYPGFHGVWSWDSWKHARALALFAPALAKDQVRVMLDWQDDAGMVPDVIYADASENNWRDTKPPLAAWSVAGILDVTGDTAFVEEVYPALRAYHAWWYAHRDHDGDGLCEYGSTDGTRIAAAWESGMDNAVRFDDVVMVSNGPGAWSMDQESVDLNAYLYAEKGYLAALAGALGLEGEAAAFRRDAESLAEAIRRAMWHEGDGWFYDVGMETGEAVRVRGPEGWIPLWAGVATAEQARRVAATMMDPERFLARVPLPTLAMDHPAFDPTDGYWRGPVWLDQAYFGVRGLERYGLDAEAAELRRRLLTGPEGLSAGDPIRENYHPRTGAGLNADHFSWSAAHLLLLLDRRDGVRP